ncbi:unnamed protein product [Chironomus riparius]|uniref:F-box domain-containing protein n=1 Tax=Chironomus riparius TaxID=315576 RepID=A0A9N9S703_9DIPT|nr:unnamed protein product [Chironomus riparius]
MDTLPEELLINIFSYLPLNCIISLSLSCKRFCEIINCSHELLKVLTVKFSKETANYEWIGSRSYTNVTILEDGMENFLENQKFLRDSLTKLTVFDKSLRLSTFLDVLRCSANLKELEIKENSDDSINSTVHQLPSLKLDKIKVKGELKSLKLLKNCQTRHLHVYWSSKVSQQSHHLAEFLINQTNLEVLILENFSDFSFLFPQNLLHKVQFKLKKLSIRSCSCFYVIKLKNFLDLHIDSLTHIELDSYGHRESELLKSFKNLKILKFGTEFLNICGSKPIRFFIPQPILNLHNDVLDFEVLPQIRVLEVKHWNKNFINYFNYFPNIEELTINGTKSEFYVDVDGFSELKLLTISAKKLTRKLIIPKSCRFLRIFIGGQLKTVDDCDIIRRKN